MRIAQIAVQTSTVRRGRPVVWIGVDRERRWRTIPPVSHVSSGRPCTPLNIRLLDETWVPIPMSAHSTRDGAAQGLTVPKSGERAAATHDERPRQKQDDAQEVQPEPAWR